jgi:peptidyl-prolyl cis-trans isomerase A (cyclophilin A)
MYRFSSLVIVFSLFFSQLVSANSYVVLETTQGNITIELYESEMPVTVKNFLSYVDSGFYSGTIFHQVIQDSMILGGGYNPDLSKKERQAPIQNESKETQINVRGTVGMTRLSSPHTATSEFYINISNNPQMDYKEWNIGYAVFGKVTDESMGTIDSINYVQTGSDGLYKNVPVQAIEIIKAYRTDTPVSAGNTYTRPESPSMSASPTPATQSIPAPAMDIPPESPSTGAYPADESISPEAPNTGVSAEPVDESIPAEAPSTGISPSAEEEYIAPEAPSTGI